MNIRSLLLIGHAKLAEEHTAKEQFPGALRIGSAGCFGTDGRYYGTCPRKALARVLGIEEAPTLDSQIMWQAGYRNEDTWRQLLSKSGVEFVDDLEINTISMGTGHIVGHPDLVIKTDTGELGLELKGIFGKSTADMVTGGRPKNDNLIQAAAYMFFLDIPFKLCYTMYHHANGVKPFYKIFDLRWNEKVLQYRDEDAEEWIDTLVTQPGIIQFFRALRDMQLTEQLTQRPTDDFVDGTRKRGGDPCHFCPFQTACDSYDVNTNYDRWVDNCRSLV